MDIRAAQSLRLTLWGAGSRAVVSVNAFSVTQPALEGIAPSLEGFTWDVTPWLHTGINTLQIVLIGQHEGWPFRLTAVADEHTRWIFDEADLQPSTSAWQVLGFNIAYGDERVVAEGRAGIAAAAREGPLSS